MTNELLVDERFRHRGIGIARDSASRADLDWGTGW
jgi:hypothetical protein